MEISILAIVALILSVTALIMTIVDYKRVQTDGYEKSIELIKNELEANFMSNDEDQYVVRNGDKFTKIFRTDTEKEIDNKLRGLSR